MNQLRSGGNIPLTSPCVELTVRWSAASIPSDQIGLSAFLLNDSGKVRSDNDFIFYNQPSAADGSVRLSGLAGQQCFCVDLDKVAADICKIAFAIVIHTDADFSACQSLQLTLEGLAEFLPETQNMKEKALILGQLYRHQGNWKFRALGQGFQGGLAPLATSFGVHVDDQAAAPAATRSGDPPASKAKPVIDLEKRLHEKAPRLINLAKPVKICLEKKQLTDVRARVAFVLDASGSMSHQFSSGNVQAVLDRIAALAVQFDDDEALELWAFADKCNKYDDVSLDNLDGYIERLTKRQKKGLFGGMGFGLIQGLGVGNNEPPVMREIINTYKGSTLPVYVIFITDGGVYKDKEIKQLLTEAAQYPIFWQYVGLGGSRYGILEELDDLPGRVVDNADFFPIDDFKKIPDQELYDRLLNEFPSWLKAVKKAGIPGR